MSTRFTAELVEWRGPAPYVWVTLTREAAAFVQDRAAEATYGWGAVPCEARVGGTTWETSLLPRDGGYWLPVKRAVQRAEGLALGDVVKVVLSVVPRHGRPVSGTRRSSP